MPIQIGAPRESSFAEPFGLLKDCHRRVEMFLGVLVKLSERAGEPLTAEQAASLEGALLYFREAAPRHTADEEESLFPRLRAQQDPQLAAVLQRVEALEADHRAAAPDHETADRLGKRWLGNGVLEASEQQAFRAAVARLQHLYIEHIAVEDNELFPAAARALGQREQKEIGEEMAARRRR